MEVGNDGVAVISIYNPPVNSLAIPSNLSKLVYDYTAFIYPLLTFVNKKK